MRSRWQVDEISQEINMNGKWRRNLLFSRKDIAKFREETSTIDQETTKINVISLID